MNQELIEYIEQAQSAGMDRDAIARELKRRGWDEVSINSALNEAEARKKRESAASRESSGPGAETVNPARRPYKRYLLIATALILLAGGGYFAWAQYFSNPDRVWDRAFANMSEITSGRLNIVGSYLDAPPEGEENSTVAGLFGEEGELKFTFNVEGDYALANESDVNADFTSTIGMESGGFKISFEWASKKIGNSLYYKLDDFPLGSLFGLPDDSDAQWVKYDLDKSDEGEGDEFLDSVSQAQITQLREAFQKTEILSPAEYLGAEKLNEKNTYHYRVSFDKAELKNLAREVYRILGKEDESSEAESLVDRLDFRKLEVWIGKSDKLVHQIEIETNFPSLIYGSLDTARGKSRDAKRIADIRQMQTALELFYNDNNRYPAAVNGFPDINDGTTKFSIYISSPPKAPTPADGYCTDEENLYWYEQTENGQNYTLQFCLGDTIGGYQAGVLEATNQGIAHVSEGTNEIDRSSSVETPLPATLNFKVQFSEFNKQADIRPPENFVDYFNEIKAKSNSAGEMANVRTLQTALELYFNDNNRYPDSLDQLTSSDPVFISEVPVRKTTEGICADQPKEYVYTVLENGSGYSLDFCLSTLTGGITEGEHQATEAGIQ